VDPDDNVGDFFGGPLEPESAVPTPADLSLASPVAPL